MYKFIGGLVSHLCGIPLPPIPVYWQTASIEDDWVLNGSEKVEIYVDVRQFCGTEINVRTGGGEITIEAHHQIRGEGGKAIGGFVRTYDIPAHQYSDDVSICLSPDGEVLKITVPKADKYTKEKYFVFQNETNIKLEVKHE